MKKEQVEGSKVLAYLNDLESLKAKCDFVIDCSTQAGYEASKRLWLDEFAGVKTKVEDKYKEAYQPIKQQHDELKDQKKAVLAFVDKYGKPHMVAYREEDKRRKDYREKKKLEQQAPFDHLDNLIAQSVGKSPAEIQGLIDSIGEINVDNKALGDKIDLYLDKVNLVSTQLTNAMEGAVLLEASRSQALAPKPLVGAVEPVPIEVESNLTLEQWLYSDFMNVIESCPDQDIKTLLQNVMSETLDKI